MKIVFLELQSLAIAFSLRWLFLFLAEDGKMRVPSRKEAFFMAEVRDICYICMI